MVYFAEDSELVFPALASVATSADAQAYLQILGEKATLDHQFGANPDFDWLESDGGVALLNGFGAYVVVDGDDAIIAAATDALIFQNSTLLDLKISGGNTDLIFDPTAQQAVHITLAGGDLTLHASTPEIFAVNTSVDGDARVITAGAATIFVEGEGRLSLTDLASDAPISLNFPELEAYTEMEFVASVEDEIVPYDQKVPEAASAQPNPEGSAYVADDDFYLSYNHIESVAQLEADLYDFTREGLDDANNILSVMPADETGINGLKDFEADILDLQEANETFVETVTVSEQIADLVFDDGTDIYWGL